MPKYFVPIALLIEADSDEEAQTKAHSMCQELADLTIVDGWTEIDNLDASEVPYDWVSGHDLYVTSDGSNFTLSIEEV